MIIIFHGDNYVASRQALNQSLPNQPLERFNASKLKASDLTQALESNSLFKTSKVFVIEHLLTLTKSKLKDQLIDIVVNNQEKTIYLWEKKTITSAVKKKLPKANIKEFKTAKIVFKFLDFFKPGSSKTLIKLFHQSLAKDPIELVFYLLCRRISQLIQVHQDPVSLKTAPWIISQLKAQAKQFDLNQLLSVHQQLLDIDYSLKTGKNILPLPEQLDLLLLNI